MTIAEAPEIVERRKPARGWRGWRGPTEHKPFPSLGWLFLDWAYDTLPSPADETKPLVYTDEQARRLIRWFEIDPTTGDYLRDTLILEEAKGWGKGPVAGSLEIGDFVGPVCFDGWDADGEPVGVPWGTGGRLVPWNQILTTSENQTENTYGYIRGMLSARMGRIADDLRLDVGRTRIYHRDMARARLEPVTNSADALSGNPITGAAIDETWLMDRQNGGIAAVKAVRYNLSKTDGRAIETTNAPIVGAGSWAEQSDPDKPLARVLHYATRPLSEPKPDESDDQLMAHLDRVYRGVPWISRPRQLATIRDVRTPWDDALRLFLNTRSPGTARAVDPREWALLRIPREVPAGTVIGIGFDGSSHRDATVLRGCTRVGYTFILGRWSRPPGVDEWHVPRAEVEQAVAEAFERYRVGRMLCDPPGWRSEIDRWAEKWGDEIVIGFDTGSNTRMAPEIDRWLTDVRTSVATIREAGPGFIGPLDLPYSHDGDEFTTLQVTDTRLRKVHLADPEFDDRTMFMLDKGPAGSDAFVADILAHAAAATMPEPEDPNYVPGYDFG